jgi:hypothetical protein
MRITHPRRRHTLAAGSVGVALLAARAYAAAAAPPIGPGGDPPPTVALHWSKGGPISPSIGDPTEIALLSRIPTRISPRLRH